MLSGVIGYDLVLPTESGGVLLFGLKLLDRTGGEATSKSQPAYVGLSDLERRPGR